MKSLRIDFTAREVTPWGGLVLSRQMLDKMGYNRSLPDSPLPQQGSNGVSVLNSWF